MQNVCVWSCGVSLFCGHCSVVIVLWSFFCGHSSVVIPVRRNVFQVAIIINVLLNRDSYKTKPTASPWTVDVQYRCCYLVSGLVSSLLSNLFGSLWVNLCWWYYLGSFARWYRQLLVPFDINAWKSLWSQPGIICDLVLINNIFSNINIS